jgi:hypothetical protein
MTAILKLEPPPTIKRKAQRAGMGSHQSSRALKDEWLTPPTLIRALGEFDLDPCSPVNRPWATAKRHFTILDDGLSQQWEGRVWLNPPYGKKTGMWLQRLAEHGNGTALVFARTETETWFRFIWPKASAILFLRGRIAFHHVTGQKGKYTGGAPSAVIAYGAYDAEKLKASKIDGAIWQPL